jgi:hypothetical protein
MTVGATACAASALDDGRLGALDDVIAPRIGPAGASPQVNDVATPLPNASTPR